MRLLAALFALLAVIAGAWGFKEHRKAEDLEYLQRRTGLLQTENDRLREALALQEKVAAQAREAALRKPIEEAVVKIRGLDFERPVVYDVLSRAGIMKTVATKLSEEYSDEDFRNVATGLGAMGLLEPGYPLKQKYIELLGEQIAAFYEPRQHRLFMFEDSSLRSTQNRIVLAHELTHALQDQNFGLLKLPLNIKTNDDLALATSALIEGDATVTMSDYMLENFSMKSLGENLSGVFTQSLDRVQKAPRYLREILIFPYMRGQEFCMALRQRGGYEAISQAFKNPPVSSAQILHPQKYFAHEEPVRVIWPDTTALGQKPVCDNVLGEMGVRVLLSDWGQAGPANAVSAGWRGDRYLVFQDAAGTDLVWKSVWDSDGQALRFLETLKAAWSKRYGLKDWIGKNGVFFFNRKQNGVIELGCPDARTVVLIDAANNTWADTLDKKFISNGQN
jgi:hypothetical protein